MVDVDIQGAIPFLDSLAAESAAAEEAHHCLFSANGPYKDYTGWLTLPQRMLENELPSILEAASRIRSLGSVLLLVGVGGSYLGARAAVELLRSPSRRQDGDVRLLYLGNTLSPDAIRDVIAELGSEDFCVNVVSKSGSTLEPALGFRVAKQLLEARYGVQEARKRIFATTDARRGILYETAVTEGYTRFVVPDDVGGRYSVLSAVGLLPMAAAGIDIAEVLRNAAEAFRLLSVPGSSNPAMQYAAARRGLLRSGKAVELLSCFEPSFRFFAEWWKQLFGESEGKSGSCLFPASLEYVADLHSMGQLVQEGPRNLLETTVRFSRFSEPFPVPSAVGSRDGLDYLAGFDFGRLQQDACEAVIAAHIAGAVPSIKIDVTAIDERGFADLVSFFEVSCAISAMIGNVNPFDQPGVELYKKNTLALLSSERG